MSSRERRLLDKDIEIRKLQGELKHYKTCFFSCVFELEHTRKALDVAVDALKEINDRYESEEQRGREEDDSPDWWDFAMDTGEILAKALEQITALEQKGVK